MSSNARKRPWAPDEIELVRACYEFTPTAELAELLERPLFSCYHLAKKLGVKKHPDVIREMSREMSKREDHGMRRHQFQKGLVPHNKGVRMPGWAPGRMASSQFTPGHRPKNWMPVGAKRTIMGFRYTKIADERRVPYTVNWKPTHILLWQEHRGPVPAGHAVVFRDGNRDNIRMRNLELISRAELMVRNTIHNLPKPLVQVIMLNGALKRSLALF